MNLVGRIRFNRRMRCILFLLVLCSVVALRIELSATRLSAGYGQPALDYRVPLGIAVTRSLRTTIRPIKSGTPESNRNPPAPKAGVLPSAPLPDCLVSQNGRI